MSHIRVGLELRYSTYVVDNLGPHLDITRVSGAILLGGKQSQLVVKVLPVDSVHGQAPCGLAVLVVVGD